MPTLRYRNDGVPYIVTSFRDEDEGVNTFATWYPNQTAVNQFNASQITDGDHLSWHLFHRLREEGHIVPGDGRGGIALPSGQIQEIQTTQNQIRVYFDYISLEQTPDYENLNQIFKGCLFEIRKYDSNDTQNDLYLTVAGEIRERLQDADCSPEKLEFFKGIRNSLISNIPARAERPIKVIFGLGDEEWECIRHQRPSVHHTNNGHMDQIVAPVSVREPLFETLCGSLESLSELLAFAYEKKSHGMDVEIEVRIKRN